MDNITTDRPDRRRPWGGTRDGFEDSTRRRVEIRMLFLGFTQASLGARMDPPVDQQAVYQYLVGKRPWRRRSGDPLPHAIDRFAAALGVSVEALEPGGPWAPLLAMPDERAR